MKIGDRLKELRVERNLSREQVAAGAFLSAAQVRDYELSKWMPSFEVACRLADALGVSVDELRKPAKTIYELQPGAPTVNKDTGEKVHQEPKKKAAPRKKRPKT